MDAQMIFYDYDEGQTYEISGEYVIDTGEGFHFTIVIPGGGGSDLSTSFQCSTDTTLFYL